MFNKEEISKNYYILNKGTYNIGTVYILIYTIYTWSWYGQPTWTV